MGDTTFELRAPVIQLDVIDLAARVAGMSTGDFLLWAASRQARQVLLDGGPDVHSGREQACGHPCDER